MAMTGVGQGGGLVSYEGTDLRLLGVTRGALHGCGRRSMQAFLCLEY